MIFDDDADEWRTVVYWRHRKVKERIRNARIPQRYADARLSEMKGRASAVAASWAGQFEDHRRHGDGLLVVGGRRGERTELLSAMLHAIVSDDEHRAAGVYVTAVDLVEMFMETSRGEPLGSKWGNPHLLGYMHKTFDVLCIDGLGEEPTSDFKTQCLVGLLTARFHSKLPTIVAAHSADDTELGDRYNEFLPDVLTDVCNDLIRLGGE